MAQCDRSRINGEAHRARATAIPGAFEQDIGAPKQAEGYPPPHIAPTVWIGHWQPGVAIGQPQDFAMSQDQQKQEPADRVYLGQDDYPESFGFGTFGAAYRRTYYDVVRGSAIPKFDRGERDRDRNRRTSLRFGKR